MEVDQNFDKICRSCLSESSNMKSLFTKIEGGQQLLDLLVITANIEVNSEDALPKQVCGDCESFLYQADEFKRRCRESEMILKNVCPSAFVPYPVKNDDDSDQTETKMTNSCLDRARDSEEETEKPDFFSLFASSDISLKKLDTSKVDAKHTVKTEISTEYENMDYSDNFDDRGDFTFTVPLEIEIEAMKEVTTYKCVCGEEYKSKDKFKEHVKLKKCAKKHSKQDSNKTCIPIKNKIECPKCNLSFDTINNWTNHQMTHTKVVKKVVKKDEDDLPKLQCSLCLRRFKNKKTLTKHIKRHEVTDNVKYICSKCKREFKYKAFLESHMLSVHVNGGVDGYTCEDCPEKFSSRKSLEAHTDSHRKKKNSCPFCNKSFFMVCTLKDHLRIHTGEKPFLCSICGKGFSQKNNLAQHVRRHMGVKPYKCDTCSMEFVSKGELDSHMRKHTGAHPFICDECGSGFTTSSALVKHRRTHTGERPYCCDLCPMKFAATGTLKNHRRTHTGERPYQCSHCEKSFVQRSDLISHIRCHTGERPFVCPQCGQAFRKAAAMKTHVKMHSRETVGMQVLNMHCDAQMQGP